MKTRGVTIRHRTNKKRAHEVRYREYINGEEVHRSKSFSSPRDAERFAAKIANQKNIVRSVRRELGDDTRKTVTFPQAMDIYFNSYRTKKKASSQGDVKELRLMNNAANHYGWKHLLDITFADVTDIPSWCEEDKAKGIPKRGRKAKVLTELIVRILNRLKKHYRVNEDVCEVEAPEHIQVKRYCWEDDEAVRIMREITAPPPAICFARVIRGSAEFRAKVRAILAYRYLFAYRPIAEFIVNYAIRPIEGERVLVSDWDFHKSRLTIRGEVAKNGHERSFFVDPSTAAILNQHVLDRPGSDRLFLTHTGNRWSNHQQGVVMKRVLRKLGIRGSLYSARHYATTRLCEWSGGNLKLVMSITGHRQLSELSRYWHARQVARQQFALTYKPVGSMNADGSIVQSDPHRDAPQLSPTIESTALPESGLASPDVATAVAFPHEPWQPTANPRAFQIENPDQ